MNKDKISNFQNILKIKDAMFVLEFKAPVQKNNQAKHKN